MNLLLLNKFCLFYNDIHDVSTSLTPSYGHIPRLLVLIVLESHFYLTNFCLYLVMKVQFSNFSFVFCTSLPIPDFDICNLAGFGVGHMRDTKTKGLCQIIF